MSNKHKRENKCKGAWLELTTGVHAGKTICQQCHRQRKNKGDPDPCLGMLPGVVSACCGHAVGPGYIIFESMVGVSFPTTALALFLPTQEQEEQMKAGILGEEGEMAVVPLCPKAIPRR